MVVRNFIRVPVSINLRFYINRVGLIIRMTQSATHLGRPRIWIVNAKVIIKTIVPENTVIIRTVVKRCCSGKPGFT